MENTNKKYEHEALVQYCINREIVRSKTNIFIALIYLILLELLSLIFAFVSTQLLVFFGFSLSFSLLHFLASFVVIVLFIKKILIVSIELYQHYAPEQTRRKCTLKPSCSDYSIIALNKYTILKALRKIYIRLFKTCNGIYKIDYP